MNYSWPGERQTGLWNPAVETFRDQRELWEMNKRPVSSANMWPGDKHFRHAAGVLLDALRIRSPIISPLSQDTSHPAENDKYSEPGFVLMLAFACWSSSCLLLLWVSAHSKTGNSVGRRMKTGQNISCWITTNSENSHHLAAWCITKVLVCFVSCLAAVGAGNEHQQTPLALLHIRTRWDDYIRK